MTVAAALGGCHAGLGSGPAAPPLGPGDFTIIQRAETGPIAALAIHGSYLWAAGVPGLRRWNVDSGEYEEVAAGDEPGGSALRAVAVDDDGAAWVAGATEVGRWMADPNGSYKYESTGSPGTVTVLAPGRPVATQGVWAGGPGGLSRFDGHRWSVVDGLLGIAVTSLALDDDGRGVWIGTRGKGLYRTKGSTGDVVPAPGGEGVAADEIVGTAMTAVGTRVVVGNVAGEARLYALTLAGTYEFRAPARIHAVALVARGSEALLVAGPAGREQAYTLRPFAPGEAVPAGGLRFSSLAEEKGGRWAGVPTAEVLPPGVTAVAVGGAGNVQDLFCGSASRGIARAEPGRPHYLDGAQLVGDANRFSVACETRARCLVVTEGPRAWLTDGDRYEETSLGSAPDATVLGFASDSQGGLYALFADPRFSGLVITRREAGRQDWQPWRRIALKLPAHGTPKVSFAAVSPTGVLWVGLRLGDNSGDEVGYGAVEIDLQTGVTVQHRPRRAGEAAAVEALPLPADLTGILFADGATWYASLAGVYRFAAGQFRGWGESDGLPSDLVWSVGRGGDGTIWAATSEGLARWDGSSWHPAAGAVGATRGLATDDRGRLWVATARGLRLLPPGAGDPSSNLASNLSSAPVLVEGDMRDLVRDRFGRTWALSADSIALVDARISTPALP